MDVETPAKYEDSSITVCVRARPPNANEIKALSKMALCFRENRSVDLFENGVPSDIQSMTDNDVMKLKDFHRFNFDLAFDISASQEEIYEKVGRPLVASSFKGFNNCIFAYGQTGSGKSYTMMGSLDSDLQSGIIPRLCKDLFREVEIKKKKKEEVKEKENSGEGETESSLDIAFYVSYLEIYMERIRCLLTSSTASSGSLKVRQHPTLGIYVEGLKEVPVASCDQLLALMSAGNAQRRTSKTAMNDTSSRSHAVFSIKVIQKNVMCQINSTEIASEVGSKINLVDLAGSERAKSTKAEGERLKEGAQINKSLTTLGIVINALAEQSKQGGKGKSTNFIPYRDSTLTFLLKESLGGNSKTLMVATLSPIQLSASESLSTLRYADRAKSIVTRAFINETPQDKCIRELKEEVTRLREHIMLLETKANSSNSTQDATHNVSQMRSELSRAEELIGQHTKTNKDREIEGHLALESIQKQSTLHVTRKEPYILNIDGAGDWVMQYLVVTETYITSKPLENAVLPSDAKENDSKIYIVVPEELAEGVGNPHCVFVKKFSGLVCLSSFSKESETYLNEQPLDLGEEYNLESGDMISVGAELLQFRFMNPTAPLKTGRRRNLLSSARDNGCRSARYCDPRANFGENADGEDLLTDPSTISARRGKGSPFGSPDYIPVLPLNSPRRGGRSSREERSENASQFRSTTSTEVESSEVSLSGRVPSSHRFQSSGITLPSPRASPKRREKITADGKESYLQYNFFFLGPQSSGKSSCILNLALPKKFSFFSLHSARSAEISTFGAQYTNSQWGEPTKLRFREIGGFRCFSVLGDLVASPQVTYVLTFPLKNNCAKSVQFALDIVGHQAYNRSATFILLGTFFDSHAGDVKNEFEKAEKAVVQYFESMDSDFVPSISGKFAISNRSGHVKSFCVAKVFSIAGLQQWFMDHAAHQSSLDTAYPNSMVPKRCISLHNAILRYLHKNDLWFLPLYEFNQIASQISNDYVTDPNLLQKETRLLVQWGSIFTVVDDMVVIDPDWASLALATLSLCRHFAITSGDLFVDVPPDKSEGLLVFSSKFFENFKKNLFDPRALLAADDYGLLTHGVMTKKVFQCMFKKLLELQKKSTFEDLLHFFQASNWMFECSKLCFYNDSDRGTVSPGNTEQLFERDSFYLLPFCFFNLPSSAVTCYLTRFLLGPFFSLKFPVLPCKFFSRLISSLSSVACAVYVGPYNMCATPSEEHQADGAEMKISCIPATPRFWSSAVWLVGPGCARAFIREEGKSIHVSFHTVEEKDNSFVEAVLKTISTLDTFDISEWSVAVQPSGFSQSSPIGGRNPDNISYYILEEKLNYAYFLRRTTDEYVHPSQLEDTIVYDDELVLNVTPFLRKMNDFVDLEALEQEILNEKKPHNVFSDVLISLREAFSRCSGQPEKDKEAGRSLDVLLDSLARLQ